LGVAAAQRAASDHDLAAAIPDDDDATALLRDAVRDRARRIARAALWAASMLADRRDAMAAAIDSLDGGPSQLANALETLEAAGDATLVRPLLAFWEPAPNPAPTDGAWLERALHDDDPTIRQCAELVRARREGVPMSTSPTTIPVIERVLFLRKVPLFADLPPLDLERVARIAEERGYADGEPIGAQGEPGEDLHIVVEGTIRVVQERDGVEHELARRSGGEVVGELSLLRNTPRMASLIAEGNVRTIRIGNREFESMLRERPEVALGVMRVLADRVVERSADPAPEPSEPQAEASPEPSEPQVDAAPEASEPQAEAAPEPEEPAADALAEPAEPPEDAAEPPSS
jgi:hypothetical protein